MSSPIVPTAPGAIPGPMTVGRILDRIAAILRGNIRLFLELSAVPAAAMLATYGVLFGVLRLEGIFPPPAHVPQPANMVWTLSVAMLLAMVPMMLAYAVFQAAACHASIQANRGRKVTFREAYAVVWRYAGRYMGLMVLQALCIVVPMLLLALAAASAVAAPALAGRGTLSPGAWFLMIPLIMLAYLVGFAYAVWMSLRLGLAFPACVEENLTAVEALKRSGVLTRKAKGRMFLVLLVVYAISYAAFLVVEMVVMAVVAVLALVASGMHLHVPYALGMAGFAAAAVGIFAFFCVWMALIWAGYAISLSVLYEDQVFRIDGPAAAPANGDPE